MRYVLGTTLLSIGLVIAAFSSQAACPNLANSVTIPLSGSANLTVCDQVGNTLPGPYTVNNGVNSGGALLSGTTTPSVVNSSGVLQFSANGAPTGTGGSFYVCYTPAAKCVTITYAVGAAVTGLTVGTTTP